MAQSSDNEILDMSIPNLVDDLEWDDYGRKIEGVLMYDSTESIQPVIVVSDLATLTGNDEFDMPADGDTVIVYTVTAEDGTEAEWRLFLSEEDPSTEAELEAFNIENVFTDGDGDDAVYFVDDTTVLVAATDAATLAAINVTELEVSFGAIVDPSAVSPTTTDFTTMPKTYTVTAQDAETATEYAISIYKEETVIPVVATIDSTYTNFGDSVMVTITDASLVLGGGIGLFQEDLVVADLLADDALMDEAVENGLAIGTDLMLGDSKGVYYIPTDGLVPDTYDAYAVDYFGNLSAKSVNNVVITVDTVEVDALSGLMVENVVYKYMGGALVSHTHGSKAWISDGSMAIEIDDADSKLTVTRGDSITGLIGMFVDNSGLLQFKPSQAETDLSSGNDVMAMEVSIDDLMDEDNNYQSQLVKLTNVAFDAADGTAVFVADEDLVVFEILSGDEVTFATAYGTANYIGEIISEEALDMIGIVGLDNVISARDSNDFIDVEGYEFNIDPEEYAFDLVVIDQDSKEFTITNSGSEVLKIKSTYIVGDNSFRVDANKDTEVMGYNDFYFNVDYSPIDFGSNSATLFVELEDGTVHEVALEGNYSDEIVVDFPYASNFDDEDATAGWTIDNVGTGWGFLWGGYFHETNSFFRVGYDNAIPPSDEVYLISPPIDLSDAKEPGINWDNKMSNIGYAANYLFVSTDNKQTWDTITSVRSVGKLSYNIAEYAGESKVFVAFYLREPDYGYGSPISGWSIDDFSLEESPINPIFVVNSDSIGMGASDGTNGFGLQIKNVGISYFTVKSVTLSGDAAFTLDGAPTKAVDVTTQLDVDVLFDGTLGLQEGTVTIVYNDPREDEFTVEIPVSAIGVACSAATAAVVGDNTAPYASSWFSYTPTNDALLTISSCGGVVDTDVEVYKGCDGEMVAANDDSGCPNYASEVTFPAEGGVTYMINWTPKWSTSGFTWTLTSEDLATAPVLLTAEASALNATTGKTVLTFEDMIELIPAKKGVNNVHSMTTMDKYKVLSKELVQPTEYKASKTFVPDGDDEGEPNDSPETAPVLSMGTEDAPTKITGKFGVTGDQDWFAVPVADIGFYFYLTLEVEDGACEIWWYMNGIGGWKDIATPDSPSERDWTQFINTAEYYEVDTMYILVRRSSADMDPVEEPGLGYNLKMWSSAPPTFSIFRDNQLIAGPESMAFSYIDQGINLDQEYCYTVTQELIDETESEMSNTICVTATAGTGDICTKSVVVEAGLNTSPKSPYWFAYTATSTKMLTITSNIEENGDPSDDWNDTWLFVYGNCDDDTPMYENDDVESGVIRTSYLQFAVQAGETYLINWRRWAAEGEDNAYDAEPFFFKIIEEDMLAGDIVETAIALELPLVDMDGTTTGFNHDYDATSCDYIFTGGFDVCYSFSVPYGGTISGGIEGNLAGMHILKGAPGSDKCIAFAKDEGTGGTFTDAAIDAGDYYIIISSKSEDGNNDAIDFVMDLVYTVGAKQTVTFNVDMNNQITLGNFDPATDTVDVTGTFNLWENTADLTDADADGIYTYELPTQYYAGEELKYKYRVNADWDKAEFSSDIYNARELVVVSGTNATDDLFNNEELPTFDVTLKVVMTRQIELANFDATTNVLGITASVSNVPELTDADGIFVYETSVTVTYGDIITYVYNIDGTDEETGDRVTDAIMENTSITVWYNNDDKVNVNDDLASNLSIYPNPANSNLTVEFGLINTDNTVVQIVNLNGQVLESIDMNSRTLVNINVTEYSKGVYYLKVTNGESVSIQKVVIQ